MSQIQGRHPRVLFAVYLLALAVVFIVPFYVPVTDGVSFSYRAGYSNKTALFLILTICLAFGIWTKGMNLRLPDSNAPAPSGSSRRIAWVAVASVAVGAALLWLGTQRVPAFNEAAYFMDRYEMWRLGGRIYRDFSFDYGPLMFYLPVWIAHLTGFSVPNSHYIAWMLEWMLGVWMLWKTVSIAARGTSSGRTVFMLFWAFWFGLLVLSGPNYTPLRFCSILLLALGTHRLYERGTSLLLTFGLASAGVFAMLLFSPEQGVAFTLGTVLFFLVCRRRPFTLAALAFFLLAVAGELTLCHRAHVLDSMLMFGGGVLNIPLLFTLQNAALIGFLMIAGCVVISAFRNGQRNHPLLYLICVCLVSTPAAFSCAEVGHIMINTMGALIAVLVVLSQYEQLWKWGLPVFVAVVGITWANHFSTQCRPIIKAELTLCAQSGNPRVAQLCTSMLSAVQGRTRTAESLAKIASWRRAQEDSTSPHLLPGTLLIGPMGFKRSIDPLPGDPHIYTGYAVSLLPYVGGNEVANKIAEMSAHPLSPLILLESQGCEEDYWGDFKYMRNTLFAPFMPRMRKPLYTAKAVCKFIDDHYEVSRYVPPAPGYNIWVRKL